MPFFENIGKKASEAAAKAVQKAQEITGTAKLNTMIADEEKRINNAYYQIGKLYVSVHGAEGEEAFAGLVAEVMDAEQKITDYRRQVQDMKGVQRCEKCGAEVPKGVAFCSSCGASMPKAEAPAPDDLIRCENCGAMVERDTRFCTSCGRPMAGTVAQATSSVGTSEEPVTKRACPNCGAELADDAVFCTECGTKI